VTSRAVRHRTASFAAALAFASAAVTAYWTVGGTALLDTVGGAPEEFVRTGGPVVAVAGLLIVAVKIAAGLVALGLARPGLGRTMHRLHLLAGGLGSAVLTIYGGLFVAVGALVLTGVLQSGSPIDRRVLTWHVLEWDLWFVLWGLALAVATWQSSRPDRLLAREHGVHWWHLGLRPNNSR